MHGLSVISKDLWDSHLSFWKRLFVWKKSTISIAYNSVSTLYKKANVEAQINFSAQST